MAVARTCRLCASSTASRPPWQSPGPARDGALCLSHLVTTQSEPEGAPATGEAIGQLSPLCHRVQPKRPAPQPVGGADLPHLRSLPAAVPALWRADLNHRLHHLQSRHPANTEAHRSRDRAAAHRPIKWAAAVGWRLCASHRELPRNAHIALLVFQRDAGPPCGQRGQPGVDVTGRWVHSHHWHRHWLRTPLCQRLHRSRSGQKTRSKTNA
jgi:hypothetical protein